MQSNRTYNLETLRNWDGKDPKNYALGHILHKLP